MNNKDKVYRSKSTKSYKTKGGNAMVTFFLIIMIILYRERILKDYVSMERIFYDFIIIDCCPSLGMLTINALATSDSIIIPVQPTYLPVKGLQQLFKSIAKVRRSLHL